MKVEELRLAGQWAIVMTPRSHHRIGRDRLYELQERRPPDSAIDSALLSAVRGSTNQPEVLIFRGVSGDGSGSWAFADDLSSAEVDELAYRMIRSQLPLYRELVARGITLFLKVGWPPRESEALEAGARQIVSEREKELETMTVRDTDRALAELDIWMLKHLSYWLFTSYEECVASFLPRTLRRLDGRRSRLARLVADLSLSYLQ